MTKEKQATERVRSIKTTEAGEPDYSIVSVARAALNDFGYDDNLSDMLACILLELRADGPEVTATAFKLFRKIAGVKRKPRAPKAT